MRNINIRKSSNANLFEFLESKGYNIDLLDENVSCLSKDDELPIFIMLDGNNLFFEVDLGNISEIATQELYFKLLDLNSEILPVSLAFNSTNKEDVRLTLVESREVENLDDNELLSTLTALEVASDKVEILLSEYLN